VRREDRGNKVFPQGDDGLELIHWIQKLNAKTGSDSERYGMRPVNQSEATGTPLRYLNDRSDGVLSLRSTPPAMTPPRARKRLAADAKAIDEKLWTNWREFQHH
jgi:hypothetical protein